MDNFKESLIIFFFWMILVLALIADQANIFDFEFFSFPRQKGQITHIEDYVYDSKKYSLLSLRQNIYVIPPHKRFVNPLRINKIKKDGIMIASSIDEAYRMIHTSPLKISEILEFYGTYKSFNIYTKNDNFYLVPDRNFTSKKGDNYLSYNEILVNGAVKTMDDIKAYINEEL
jgi:hypothetical protein